MSAASRGAASRRWPRSALLRFIPRLTISYLASGCVAGLTACIGFSGPALLFEASVLTPFAFFALVMGAPFCVVALFIATSLGLRSAWAFLLCGAAPGAYALYNTNAPPGDLEDYRFGAIVLASGLAGSAAFWAIGWRVAVQRIRDRLEPPR